MALDKLVDSSQLDSDLTSVANAIRTKGGTSAQLAFPQGFVDAVEAIETGGGGYTVDEIGTVNGISGALVFNGRIKRASAFVGCTGITSVVINSSDQGTVGNVFQNCTNLVSVTDNNTSEFGGDYFSGCTKLTTLVAPKLVHVSARSLRSTKIRYLVLPNGGFIWNTGCGGCTSLIGADFGYQLSGGSIEVNSFSGATSMNILVWRNTKSVSNLKNISAFANTPFASGKAGGTLYVPQALIANYQSATNWSTILGYANNQIKSIESTATDPDAPVDLTTHYIDGTPIPTT